MKLKDSDQRSTQKVNNVENIVTFVSSLASRDQILVGYELLFNEMERHKHLDDPTMFILWVKFADSSLYFFCQDKSLNLPENMIMSFYKILMQLFE